MLTLAATRAALTAPELNATGLPGGCLRSLLPGLGIDDKPESDSGDTSVACSGDANEESLDDRLPEQGRSAPSIRCPNCNRPMTCTQFSYRPSWKLIMAQVKRGEHPEWFEP